MPAVLDRLVLLLPANLRPYAKAVVPLVLAIAAVIAQWGSTGTFDLTEILTAVGGVLTSLLVRQTPNKP
jgi:hypothetical protein